MKVLVVSQPVFSNTNNMGKTLKGYFKKFDPSEIAQLYFRKGTPKDVSSCENYYSFSDEDAIISIIKRNHYGKRFCKEEIKRQNAEKVIREPQEEAIDKIYKIKSKHKAWVLIIRDFLRSLSAWKNKELLNWIEEMDPDLLFFAAGDMIFSYEIVRYLAIHLKKPLVIVCLDDFYINNRNKYDFLGEIRQKRFLKTVKKTMDHTAALFTICDSMNRAYTELFHKKCYTLYTSAEDKKLVLNQEASQISYIGNIGCGRCQSLLQIGEALSKLEGAEYPKYIDVYSGSNHMECIEMLKNGVGVRFHGAISENQVLEVMSNSMAVIHTESFEKEMMDRVRFSVSTKIAESLMYGPCMIAYGPEGIASIDYLKENHAAYVISSPEGLAEKLKEFFDQQSIRENILKNARLLAHKNHDDDINPKKVREWIQEIVDCNGKESTKV